MNVPKRRDWGPPFGNEVVLAFVSTMWALFITISPPDTEARPLIARVVESVGGFGSFLAVLWVLAALQWLAIVVTGWPPRARSVVTFAAFLWWCFVTVVVALAKVTSVVWPTTAGLAGIAFVLWLRLRREVVRVTWDRGRRE